MSSLFVRCSYNLSSCEKATSAPCDVAALQRNSDGGNFEIIDVNDISLALHDSVFAAYKQSSRSTQHVSTMVMILYACRR